MNILYVLVLVAIAVDVLSVAARWWRSRRLRPDANEATRGADIAVDLIRAVRLICDNADGGHELWRDTCRRKRRERIPDSVVMIPAIWAAGTIVDSDDDPVAWAKRKELAATLNEQVWDVR